MTTPHIAVQAAVDATEASDAIGATDTADAAVATGAADAGANADGGGDIGAVDVTGPAVCEPLLSADLEQVIAIEQRIYPFPWSRGNFEDSLASGYIARLLRDVDGRVLGYFLLMPVLDEVHLLNVGVDADLQRLGYGRRLMREIVAAAQAREMRLVLLEVRVSNLRALALYRHFGFEVIGRRKNYYPAADGQREDAIMMTLPL